MTQSGSHQLLKSVAQVGLELVILLPHDYSVCHHSWVISNFIRHPDVIATKCKACKELSPSYFHKLNVYKQHL
jgi:hypothetical protein